MGAKEAVAKAFRMDEVAWRRHANPWSVWTRLWERVEQRDGVITG